MGIWDRLRALVEAGGDDDDRPPRPPAYDPAPIQATKSQSGTTVAKGVPAKRAEDPIRAKRAALEAELDDIKARMTSLPRMTKSSGGSQVIPSAPPRVDRAERNRMIKRAGEIVSQLRSLGGKSKPQSGLAAAQRAVDTMHKSSPEVAARMARDKGVPSSAERTTKRLNKQGLAKQKAHQEELEKLSHLVDSIDDEIMQARNASTRLHPDDQHAARKIGIEIQAATKRRQKYVDAIERTERALADILGDDSNYDDVVQRWSAEKMFGAGAKKNTDVDLGAGSKPGLHDVPGDPGTYVKPQSRDEPEVDAPNFVEPGARGPFPKNPGTWDGEPWSVAGTSVEKPGGFVDKTLGQRRRTKVTVGPKQQTRFQWDADAGLWRTPTSWAAHYSQRVNEDPPTDEPFPVSRPRWRHD